jgi:hypothetical protein
MDKINLKDQLSFADDSNMKHGLRGHVKIELENTETKERKFWYEDDNIIPISGYQWILMKMFGLHLDSVHDPNVKYEEIGKDTSLVIPDLNEVGQLGIGRDPQDTREGYGYTPMNDDISSNHFIQGFLVGNGGAAEDVITTKNTDYSYTNLRSPIPFQQVSAIDGLDSSMAGKYLGVFRQSSTDQKSYFIKKFDSRAHIYHNWWRDGQRWDYLDPVVPSELGPGRNGDNNVTPKTNRIETYAEVEMSIDVKNGDCMGYFAHSGNNETAKINELGLVAFDTVPGERSTVEQLYNTLIKRLITIIFDEDRGEYAGEEVVSLAGDISTVLQENLIYEKGQTNINNFIDNVVNVLVNTSPDDIDYAAMQVELCRVDEHDNPTNIGVQAYYNQNHVFQYFTDKFLDYLAGEEFSALTTDEAQRIKLVTYYTFNSIPLQENWKVLISYRIYAN